VNKGKIGLESGRVRAFGALWSLQSKEKLSAETRPEMHCISNTDKEKSIEDYVYRETAVAKTRVQDAETAIMPEQERMGNVEKGRSITIKSEISLQAMLNAIGDSRSDLASSKDEEDGQDEDHDEEDTKSGKLSEDDEPGWVMGTISKTVQPSMESFGQKQMRIDELMQHGRGDAAD
jgi:hypothetical protein